MTRKTYIQIGGKLYDKAELSEASSDTPAILGDIPEFVSPLDGSVVSGRAAYREHCRRHNVVPSEELKGLPPKPMNMPYNPPPQERQQTRQMIADIINSRSDLWRHFKG